MIACAGLLDSTPALVQLVATLNQRRDLTLTGLTQVLLAKNVNTSNHYFVRSVDPADGLMHGKLGQKIHGYFEASPNHDAG
jgi:hypothetical protein